MKKFLSLALVAMLLGTMASCKGKTESQKVNDSVAEMTGKMMGTNLKFSLQQNQQMAQQLNKDELIKGIMAVVNMDTTKNSQSYINGLQIGMQIYGQIAQLESQGISIDRRLVINELKKAFYDKTKAPLDINKIQEEMTLMTTEYQALINRALIIKGKENEAEGQKYMQEQMKKDKDFKQTKSGIAYKVIKEGSGENFKETDYVDVAYVGKHVNGKEFDNSQGKAVPLPMQQLTPGFREMLTLMKPGSKVIAIIPGKLAYGEDGDPRAGIGPNETLVFEITAQGVRQAQPMPANAQSYPGRPAQGQPQGQPKSVPVK